MGQIQHFIDQSSRFVRQYGRLFGCSSLSCGTECAHGDVACMPARAERKMAMRALREHGASLLVDDDFQDYFHCLDGK